MIYGRLSDAGIDDKTQKPPLNIVKGGLVRKKGLEPPRLAAPDPKSGAATNYATSALGFCEMQR